MNNLKKIGLSALAGSLVAVSAQAAEMAVSGSAQLTYTNGNSDEVTGNPYGMNTSLGFTGTGDVNGYETTLFVTAADQFGGMSSASLTVDLGDMGKISFDQGVGIGGISTIDDKTPSANEEVWDGLDSGTGDSNGLVGGGNSGVFVYSNTFQGSGLSVSVGKGGSAANKDNSPSGGAVSGTTWDFALTNDTLAPGVNAGIGYGEIANGNGNSAGGADDTDTHQTAFVTYTNFGVSVGFQLAAREDNTDGGAHEESSGWGVAYNTPVEGLSVSYGEREIEFQKSAAAHITEDQEGFAVAYTMGSAKIVLQNNESTNNSGTQGNNDENTEIALSLSF
jgi:outer membrane protein OmpU